MKGAVAIIWELELWHIKPSEVGSYWPTTTEDARNLVQKCEKC